MPYTDQGIPHSGSFTSRMAAELVSDLPEKRLKVVKYLLMHGPATDEEMQVGIPMPPNTQRPRRVELVTAGFIEDSGKTRKTASGREAVVWRLTSLYRRLEGQS